MPLTKVPGKLHIFEQSFINDLKQHQFYGKNQKETDLSWGEVIRLYKKSSYLDMMKINNEDYSLDSFKEDCMFYVENNNLHWSEFNCDEEGIHKKQWKPLVNTFETNGKIVVENNLTYLFESDAENEPSCNGTQGTIDFSNYYHERGLIINFVGNSCPTFVFNGVDEIVVGTQFDEDNDEELIPEGFKKLCSVTTDLWWYSLCDYDVYLEKMKDKRLNTTEGVTVVDIPSGKWEVEHYYGISSKEYHEIPYSRIKKVN